MIAAAGQMVTYSNPNSQEETSELFEDDCVWFAWPEPSLTPIPCRFGVF